VDSAHQDTADQIMHGSPPESVEDDPTEVEYYSPDPASQGAAAIQVTVSANTTGTLAAPATHGIKAVTGGCGSQHRLLWEDGTVDWWQSSLHTQNFKLDSAEYVGKQVHIDPTPLRNRSCNSMLGIIASVCGSVFEVLLVDGATAHLDVNENCLRSDQQSVEWLVDWEEQKRWLNDSHVQWESCSEQVQGARAEWIKHKKDFFPLEEEAEAILEALVSNSVLDPAVPADATVIKSVQERRFRNIPAQQGSLLKDVLDVLESVSK